MPHCSPTSICPPFIGKFRRGSLTSRWPRSRRANGRRRAFIHILDDDSLLNIFQYCLPARLDESEFDDFPLQRVEWEGERWWYKLVKVCRRWRHLILGSAYHLRAGLYCTYGTPVAEILAHGPPIPLTIEYLCDDRFTSREKEDILLALQHRDRVRRIRLQIPLPDLEMLILTIDEEFPMLEYLAIAAAPPIMYNTGLILPKKFQAPRLCHLMLMNAAFLQGSPLITTLACLVTLSLFRIDPSTYLYLDDFLQRLSYAPRLEKLQITLDCPLPHKVVKRITREPIMTHVTFPNLHRFVFEGPVAYLEALLLCMTTPSLENLQIMFFYQPTFSAPHLLQFLSTTESPGFAGARLTFYEEFLSVMAYPHGTIGGQLSCLYFDCGSFDQQVASAVQIFDSLGTLFFAVEHLTIEYASDSVSSEGHIEDDFTRFWRVLLRSFGNVKTLFIDDGPAGEMSRCLLSDDGGSPMDWLPKLKELSYSTCNRADGAFIAFAEARKNSGCPVVLVRH